jgi:cytochrome c oxidase assembly protein subunit 15/protoheme IX farnesyltransferase
VILFGAVVRITGSGAGCGQHWPTCHGEIVHLPRTLHSVIELSHRVTSGLSLVLTVALLVAARRLFRAGHQARVWAAISLVVMIVEALIGAVLVLWRLVEGDMSVARAVMMPVHLVSTSFLVAAIALTAWAADGKRFRPRNAEPVAWFAACALGVLLVSVTGAITALGDTVLPVRATSAAAGLAADHGATAHFLQRLRIAHPVLAAVVALLLFRLGSALAQTERRTLRNAARALLGLVATQLVAGLVNVWLSAPGFMQVIHLALANLVWLALVLAAAESGPEHALAHAPN